MANPTVALAAQMAVERMSNNNFVVAESDPYVRLVAAVFAGPYGKSPMPLNERLEWCRRHLPRAYGTLATNRNWPTLIDLPETLIR